MATPDKEASVPSYNVMDDLYLVFEEVYLTTNSAQVSVDGCIRSKSMRRTSIVFAIFGGMAYFIVQAIFTASSDSAPQSHVYGLTAVVPLLTPFVMRV